MAGNSLAFIFLAAWVITTVAFVFYLTGRKKRQKRTIETHLENHDQVFLALKKSEERYDKLINHMNEGLIFTDEKDVICFVNNCACNILRADQTSILGRKISDFLLSPSDVAKLGLPYELKRHGSSHREEVQFIRQNGDIFWATLNISYLDSLNDQMPGAIITMTDITEQKIAEEKLHKLTLNLNQRVRQLDCLFEISDISNTPGISLESIFEKSIRIVPFAFRDFSGMWVEIIFGDKRFVSRNFGESKSIYSVPIKGTRKKFGTLSVGYSNKESSHKDTSLQVSEKILVKNLAERLAQIVELKELELSINERQADLLRLEQITRIGKWEIRLDDQKVTYSPEFFHILDVPEKEQKGYHLDILMRHVHPDDVDFINTIVTKINQKNLDDLHHSYRYITGQGHIKYIMGNAIALDDNLKKPVKVIGTIQDITSYVRKFTPAEKG